MTEQEWLTATDPGALLGFAARGRLNSDRQLLLVSCGFYRDALGDRVPPLEQPLLDATEGFADGVVSQRDFWERSYEVFAGDFSDESLWLMSFVNMLAKWRPSRTRAPQPALTHLVQEIFGNPFRPVSLDPSWRTDTAVPLARQMYESWDFGAMPILADALEDGGCDNAEVLAHRLGSGPHVRGCWVVDMVLGKG
jgi:hypothetical protein